MHTKNKGKPKKNNKTQAYSTPSLGPGPGPGPARASARGVLYRCVLFIFFWFCCMLGMHMPILGWKLILGWICFQTYGTLRLFKSRVCLFFGPRTGGNKNALEVPCHPHCRGRATQKGIFVIGGGCTCLSHGSHVNSVASL